MPVRNLTATTSFAGHWAFQHPCQELLKTLSVPSLQVKSLGQESHFLMWAAPPLQVSTLAMAAYLVSSNPPMPSDSLSIRQPGNCLESKS
jgi:hypothetical protein